MGEFVCGFHHNRSPRVRHPGLASRRLNFSGALSSLVEPLSAEDWLALEG
jgi:hypothetical protein